MGRLRGKTALVTGGSRGIGAAIARAMAAAGANVVVNYRNRREAADAVVRAIADDGGTALAAEGSVERLEDVAAMFEAAKERFGTIDILVNNAGVFAATPLSEITKAAFHRHFEANVLGTLLATQAAAAQFGGNGGSIVNVSSIVARSPSAGYAIYNATKAAVEAITRSLAKELGPHKIRVNAIGPGLVTTDGAQESGLTGGDFEQAIIAQTPLGRIAVPGDIAPAAVFLASDEAGWISGETLYITGGL